LERDVAARWPGVVEVRRGSASGGVELGCGPEALVQVCLALVREWAYTFAALVVEEGDEAWELRYAFHGDAASGWVHVLLRLPVTERNVPSISGEIHAADWHEREAEDLFGLIFEAHPGLGDFVLHDDVWQEGVEPMRHAFPADAPVLERHPDRDWRPRRIVHAPGAFVMPLGPVFAGGVESVHLQLETVGEDVIRAFPRLFYKYRGVEKIAERRTVADALLLAERFSATTAFAHGLAFCHAVESACGTTVPARARTLRVFLAELERLRHHAGAIAGICASTGLAVAASQAEICEEDLLRASGALAGHRYLFGLVGPGGLTRDLRDDACRAALVKAKEAVHSLDRLWAMLRLTSSFVDRLEEVGLISEADAREHGLVGPIARASGIGRDLRVLQPYDAYTNLRPDPALEREGDGYARLRVLFTEARASLGLMERACATVTPGSVHVVPALGPGAAMGVVEAPRGAAFHWVRLDGLGRIARYRVVPPSFTNWHGFHLAVEDFAFQDLPIILASLDLSVAENDR
jgi:Ni,Fe-hydrogenase III large subunit/Ni,Fe-hydrogenase III component G